MIIFRSRGIEQSRKRSKDTDLSSRARTNLFPLRCVWRQGRRGQDKWSTHTTHTWDCHLGIHREKEGARSSRVRKQRQQQQAEDSSSVAGKKGGVESTAALVLNAESLSLSLSLSLSWWFGWPPPSFLPSFVEGHREERKGRKREMCGGGLCETGPPWNR